MNFIKNVFESCDEPSKVDDFKINCLFQESFVRAFITINDKIINLEINSEDILEIYTFIKNDESKPSNSNKLIFNVRSINDFSLSYSFDLEFDKECSETP
ncbi:hypothetical protein Belba_2867 [Belliella baltica DSM 15883]|uniref:Uncharacterized protein n=1 Tax=Belliella baltica (strain DSM 15883 / CIP 108006 / LMG 21964 / BA134) TaxID=866536 RepID=I3Z831_BELBD|nr:hypothetical protein [Belliella baltica]AFL85399.1 hypothetical protein Belba_2867 [Belliella baltica DSM 15883]